MQVKEDTPPTFLVHANDDNDVPAENSLMMYAALREKKIPAELHILSEGGHGFGLASNNQHIANFRNVFIYRNICDKGWDYEMGFNFKPDEVEAALKKRDFIAAENLFESAKKRPSRIGQFNVMVTNTCPRIIKWAPRFTAMKKNSILFLKNYRLLKRRAFNGNINLHFGSVLSNLRYKTPIYKERTLKVIMNTQVLSEYSKHVTILLWMQ